MCLFNLLILVIFVVSLGIGIHGAIGYLNRKRYMERKYKDLYEMYSNKHNKKR